MPILRTKRDTGYTIVSNEIANRTDMSLKAKGLLWYLLSKPDDWSFSMASLAKYAGSDGKDSVKAGVEELKRLGYLEIDDSPKVHGKFNGGVWTVREKPDRGGFTAAEKPQRKNRSGKPAPAIYIVTKTEEPTTEEVTPYSPPEGDHAADAGRTQPDPSPANLPSCGGEPSTTDNPRAAQAREVATAFIDRLNAKTGRRLRVTDDVMRMTRARLGEGYSLDDFLTVVDNKCAEWLGTRMEVHLVAKTLLRKSHFDAYLNQTPTSQARSDGFDYDF